MRVLFVAGEVAPFSKVTPAAQLMRDLPEELQEQETVEPRIIMPRYGLVSERRNRLHEVIRLSGSEIQVGATTETLKVKVASIPGIRLQVYFMDNVHFFKRKGIFRDRKTNEVFDDNPERALFFGRAALTTAENLGWSPDVVHASGCIAGFVPLLVRTEFAGHELFANAKTVYTPDDADVEVSLDEARLGQLTLPTDLAGLELREIGARFADAVASIGGAPIEHAVDLSGEPAEAAIRAAALYRQLVGERIPV
jgi:starch synthase